MANSKPYANQIIFKNKSNRVHAKIFENGYIPLNRVFISPRSDIFDETERYVGTFIYGNLNGQLKWYTENLVKCRPGYILYQKGHKTYKEFFEKAFKESVSETNMVHSAFYYHDGYWYFDQPDKYSEPMGPNEISLLMACIHNWIEGKKYILKGRLGYYFNFLELKK